LKNKLNNDVIFFVNIGGIINITNFSNLFKDEILLAGDIGPGMCLIDKLIRDNLDQRYDENGKIAKSGKVNKRKLIKFQKKLEDSGAGKLKEWIAFDDNFPNDDWYFRSLDVKQFNYSIIKRLTLKDAAATLTELTSLIIGKLYTVGSLRTTLILCGGGRKNKFLVQRVKKITKHLDALYTCKVKLIDDYGINGDFIESQAFGYLAVRSFLSLPITFPNTTGCKEPTTGGVFVKNY